MQEDNASGKRTTADSAGGAAEVSVGVERKHRRSPKTHTSGDNKAPGSDAGGEGLFSLA